MLEISGLVLVSGIQREHYHTGGCNDRVRYQIYYYSFVVSYTYRNTRDIYAIRLF